MGVGVRTPKQIVRAVIALLFLTAASDVVIFHRENAANLLRADVASIPERFFEPAIALLSGLVLLGLLIVCYRLANNISAFACPIMKSLATITWIKLAVSVGAVAAIVCRLIRPNIKFDVISLGLFVVAVVPWLSSILDSVKFPGGWEVKFHDVERAAFQVTAGAEPKSTAVSEPVFVSIASQDPNLALVGLRIEIEKRLRQLAVTHGVPERQPLWRMLNELGRKQILDPQACQGLNELINAGNNAAHGATVQDSVAQWAIDYGPKILAVLDDRLDSSSSVT